MNDTGSQGSIKEVYSYTDEDGNELYQNCRLVSANGQKPFKVRHRTASGWADTWDGCRRVLYRLPAVIAAIAFEEPVYLCEGEKDVHTLEGFGLTATTNACGALAWEIHYSEMLNGAEVVLLQDNDQAGRQRSAKIPPELCSYAQSIKIVDFAPYWKLLFHEEMPEKADVTDFIERGGTKADLLTIVEETPLYQSPVTLKRQQTNGLSLTAEQLLHTDFPKPTFQVDRLILADGISLLAGRSKIGKSWLGLQIAQAVACGGIAFGHEAKIGKVLYLALEDSLQRLKGRLLKQNCPPTSNLLFKTSWPSMKDDGLKQFQEELGKGGYQLVVIDTYNRFVRGAIDQNDAGMMTYYCDGIQQAAKDCHTAVLIIHHMRKGQSAEDFTEDIAGSFGIVAAADTILSLYRKRGERGATLKMTGRDIEEGEELLSFDALTGCWENDESQPGVRRGSRQERIVQTIRELGGRATLTDIAKALYGEDIRPYQGGVSDELTELIFRRVLYRAEKEGREQYFRLLENREEGWER